MSRRSLGQDADGWWSELSGEFQLVLVWRENLELGVGSIRTSPLLFRYDPRPAGGARFIEADATNDAERWDRLFGKALTRAGWQLPLLDPQAWWQLIKMRQAPSTRLELILDTNAMVEGVGHWMASLFADRCELVVTAISLRELQDLHGASAFGKAVKVDKVGKLETKAIGNRQTYLAAQRFREFPGFRRVLWRELPMDDVALLLSRGQTSGKTSESDTALLRQVRKSIHDRVNGLERLFVTGDSALARRATTELPTGSVVASKVRDLRRQAVYCPTSWWPGTDEGQSVSGASGPRLLWELLAVADHLELRAENGTRWRVSAFDREMWPSDYESPWLDITKLKDHENGASSRADNSHPVPKDVPAPVPPGPESAGATTADVTHPTEVAHQGSSARRKRLNPAPIVTATSGLTEAMLYPQGPPSNVPNFEVNLRVGAKAILDTLGALALSTSDGPIALPRNWHEQRAEVSEHLTALFEALRLAEIDGKGLRPLANANRLRTLWHANDLNGVSDLFLPYRAYAEQALWPSPAGPAKARPLVTVQFARALATKLGQGMSLQNNWIPGGANPTTVEIRHAVVTHFDDKNASGRAYPIRDLFVEVFLRKLHITPYRAMAAWDRMVSANVFDGIEFRTGGSPSSGVTEVVARLKDDGWEETRLPLDVFRDYRDLLDRSKNNA